MQLNHVMLNASRCLVEREGIIVSRPPFIGSPGGGTASHHCGAEAAVRKRPKREETGPQTSSARFSPFLGGPT